MMATKPSSAVCASPQRASGALGVATDPPLCIILDSSCHRLPQRPISVDDLHLRPPSDVLFVG